MDHITFDEIINRIRTSMSYNDIKLQTDSLYKLSKDVHDSRDYLGLCSSFILESISLLVDMLNNDKCIYMRNEIRYASEKICDIITHLRLRQSITY